MHPAKHFTLLGSLVCSLCARAESQPKYVGWSMAYYPAWNQGDFPPSQIDWKAVTHIAHFALVPAAQGGLDREINVLDDAFCKAAVAEAHKHKVKIVISIGGAGAGAALADACSPTNIHVFVKNLLDFMRRYGYDGIDTDWEDGFNDAEFLAWHKELRDSLNNLTPRPLLTLAGGGYFAKHCGPAWPYVDQMNDMCYDLKYNHLAARLKQFTDVGVPKAILGVGIGIGTNPTEGTGQSVDGTAMDWDGKVAWALGNGMGGIMQWELKKDPLVAACYAHLEQYIDPNAVVTALGRPTRGPGGNRGRNLPVLALQRDERSGTPQLLYTALGARAVGGGRAAEPAAGIFFPKPGQP